MFVKHANILMLQNETCVFVCACVYMCVLYVHEHIKECTHECILEARGEHQVSCCLALVS